MLAIISQVVDNPPAWISTLVQTCYRMRFLTGEVGDWIVVEGPQGAPMDIDTPVADKQAVGFAETAR
jgi:hypothetical protein